MWTMFFLFASEGEVGDVAEDVLKVGAELYSVRETFSAESVNQDW